VIHPFGQQRVEFGAHAAFHPMQPCCHACGEHRVGRMSLARTGQQVVQHHQVLPRSEQLLGRAATLPQPRQFTRDRVVRPEVEGMHHVLDPFAHGVQGIRRVVPMKVFGRVAQVGIDGLYQGAAPRGRARPSEAVGERGVHLFHHALMPTERTLKASIGFRCVLHQPLSEQCERGAGRNLVRQQCKQHMAVAHTAGQLEQAVQATSDPFRGAASGRVPPQAEERSHAFQGHTQGMHLLRARACDRRGQGPVEVLHNAVHRRRRPVLADERHPSKVTTGPAPNLVRRDAAVERDRHRVPQGRGTPAW